MPKKLNRFEKHIDIVSEHADPIDVLALETGLSKQQIKQIMQKGAVWISRDKHTQRLRRAKKNIQTGDTLHFYYDPAVLEQEPRQPILISDENQYSVWHKPCGMLSQGSKWSDHCTITRWAEQHLQPQRNSFTVHRLDRAANGLILVAHSKKAAAKLSELFQNRLIEKRYKIWVHGQFDLQTNSHERIKVEHDIDGRSAVSYFSCLKYDDERERSLLDVRIETGRKHQIRKHIAMLGYPIVGDRLYGIDHDEDLQLCAYYLSFVCPLTNKQMSFSIQSDES